MLNETATHVEPIRLWQSICGGTKLQVNDYQHVMNCEECETLAKEIGEALNELEGTLRHRNKEIS